MIEWFQTIQSLQQEMGRYHSIEANSENISDVVLALNRQITELKKELKGVEAERDRNIVRVKMFEGLTRRQSSKCGTPDPPTRVDRL